MKLNADQINCFGVVRDLGIWSNKMLIKLIVVGVVRAMSDWENW